MATVVNGDLGIITTLTRGDSAKSTNITAAMNKKRTGLWLGVSGKAATSSKFGVLEENDLFYILPGGTFTPTAGDSYYEYTEKFLGFALNWTINVTPTIIDTTALGDRFPRSDEGRPTVDASINCQLEEGLQPTFGNVAADALPRVDFREIKRQYIEVTRFEADSSRVTAAPVAGTDSSTHGVWGISKAPQSIMFYNIASDVNVGLVSAYFAPQANWAGLSVGSGEAGARAEFTMPVTFQHSESSSDVIKSYEITWPLS